MKKILVLGGSGFVGHAVCELLTRRYPGVQLVVPTRRLTHASDLRVLPNIDVVQADVHDAVALTRLVRGCDAVINLVGILHGSAAEFDAVHRKLPETLARAMHAANQDGWYVEPAYRFALNKLVPLHGEAGVFARYSQWDQADGFGLRFREYQRYNVGLNYWPMPQVVFKIDGQWESANGLVKQELDGFNLGVGYQF